MFFAPGGLRSVPLFWPVQAVTTVFSDGITYSNVIPLVGCLWMAIWVLSILGLVLANDILPGVCFPAHLQVTISDCGRDSSSCSTNAISNWSGVLLFGMGVCAASGYTMGPSCFEPDLNLRDSNEII
jgi:hypothetical protein